jgi:hypothetical protein
MPLSAQFHSCLALATHFTNFAFEVQMSLTTATAGGIVFNADRATTHLYYFTVDGKGGYLLKAYYDNIGDYTPVAQGPNVSFSGSGWNGMGWLGVVEQGTTISLYVNRHLVQQVNSSLLAPGQLGVVAYEGEAVFSSARVWALS